MPAAVPDSCFVTGCASSVFRRFASVEAAAADGGSPLRFGEAPPPPMTTLLMRCVDFFVGRVPVPHSTLDFEACTPRESRQMVVRDRADSQLAHVLRAVPSWRSLMWGKYCTRAEGGSTWIR
eukprot:COSAG05_NODE_355_length_10856_cov_7.197174_3_plen_122_part_00